MNGPYFEKQLATAAALRDQYRTKTALTAVIALGICAAEIFALPRVATAVLQLLACLAVWAVCRNEIGAGIRALLRGRPISASFFAPALAAQIFVSFARIFSESGNAKFTGGAVLLSVTVSMGSKWMYAESFLRGLSNLSEKTVCELRTAPLTLSKKYVSRVCFAQVANEFPNAVRAAYDPLSEPKSRRFVPLTLLVVLALSALCGFLTDGLFWTALAALTAVCVPFCSDVGFALPYALTQRNLTREGGVMLGGSSAAQLRDVDTLLLRDRDIFPPERCEVLNLNVPDSTKTAKVIPYIAALFSLTESPLREAFSASVGVTAQSPPRVLQWRIIKNYGIVASVEADNVLFGNRHLLLSHNVPVWSAEKEAMLTAAGVHLVYLALNGEIAATLVLRYGEDESMKPPPELPEGDFHILVETRDCNVNETMIQRRYDFPHVKVSVSDPEEAEEIRRVRAEAAEESDPPAMLTDRTVSGISGMIGQVKRFGRVRQICSLISRAAVISGLVLTGAALLLSPENVGGWWIFAYHALCLLTVPATYFLYR